ncbi:MAG: type II secretion system F family protein [Anaerovoracaceae bacterium]|jgi:tight adherence protein C
MKIYLQSLLGSTKTLEEKYKDIYGEGEYGGKVSALRRKILKRYALIVVLIILTLIYSATDGNQSTAKVKVKDGQLISVERPKKGEAPLLLDAKVWASSDDVQVGAEKQILIAPQNAAKAEKGILKEEPESVRLERKISTVTRSLNQDTASGSIVLPTQLEDGTKLNWQQTNRSSSPILIFVFLFTGFLVYKSRYDSILAEEKTAKASIIRELPEFINKLVLLLSSGIVMQAAIEKIIGDDIKLRGENTTYFYDQMRRIYYKSKETNAPLHVELYRFARRSKVRELMRIAGILMDNVSKGSDLVVKLQREGEMLWFARKKQSEEKGRLAETKMTLPLVILLLVLVMITIAPALLGM